MNNNNENNRNYAMDMLMDILTLLSFILQIQNNEELFRQASNNDIIDNLHKDIASLTNDNRDLFDIVIQQNQEILDLLKFTKGDKDYEQT